MAVARNPELEAAIIEDPEAEGPYLVYADWLQAQGDARGELIAVQLARETARGARWGELRRRELQLLREHSAAVFGRAATWSSDRYDWRRGFVDRLHGRRDVADAAVLAHDALALVRAVADVRIQDPVSPAVTELGVQHHSLAPVLARARLRHAALLGFANLLGEPEPPLVERSGLVALAATGVGLTRYRACAFPALERVWTSWRDVDDRAQADLLEFVAQTPRAEVAITLDTDTQLDELQAHRDAARRVTELQILIFQGPRLRPLSAPFPRLRRLELIYDRPLGRLHLETLLPASLPLAHLALGTLSLAAASALAALPLIADLESLRCAVAAPADLAGLERGAFSALRVLELGFPRALTGAELAPLAPAMPRLEEVVVAADQLRAYADSPLAPRLRVVTFCDRKLQLRADHAIQLRRLPALERIRVAGEHPGNATTVDLLAALDLPIELAPRVPDVTELAKRRAIAAV
jgi:uncharacterized protein (TIGR02996 family)